MSGNNFVAITDHNEISKALQLKEKFGEQVIVGEEILTLDGEIIGLFLKEKIPPKLLASQTIELIKEQNGLVYIPHPLEKTRKGVSSKVLEEIKSSIDILEIYNARSKEPWLSDKVQKFAFAHNIATASSSDAHGYKGFGSAFCILVDKPNRNNLVELLRGAMFQKKRPHISSFFHPIQNKLKKKLHL